MLRLADNFLIRHVISNLHTCPPASWFFQLLYQDMTILKVLPCMWCLKGIPSLLLHVSFPSKISSHLSYSTVLWLFFFRHDHPAEVSDTLCMGWKLFIPASFVKHLKLCKRVSLLRPPVNTPRMYFLRCVRAAV